MTDIQILTADQLRKIVSIREQMDALKAEIAGIIGDVSLADEVVPTPSAPGKRTLSASHRGKLVKALAKARKMRWAKLHGETSDKPEKKKDRRSSPAVRAKLAAAARARWKKARAQGKSTL